MKIDSNLITKLGLLVTGAHGLWVYTDFSKAQNELDKFEYLEKLKHRQAMVELLSQWAEQRDRPKQQESW